MNAPAAMAAPVDAMGAQVAVAVMVDSDYGNNKRPESTAVDASPLPAVETSHTNSHADGSIMSKLRELQQCKDQGLLCDEEYQKMRKQVLNLFTES